MLILGDPMCKFLGFSCLLEANSKQVVLIIRLFYFICPELHLFWYDVRGQFYFNLALYNFRSQFYLLLLVCWIYFKSY